MNDLTRRFVYPFLVFAVSAFCIHAEPLGTHFLEGANPAVYPALTTMGDPMLGIPEITGTSLAVTAGAAVTDSSSSIASAETPEQIIDYSSAMVGQAVDPSSLSIATTTSAQTAVADAGRVAGSNGPTTGSPEPSTLLLVGSLFIACGLVRKRPGGQ